MPRPTQPTSPYRYESYFDLWLIGRRPNDEPSALPSAPAIARHASDKVFDTSRHLIINREDLTYERTSRIANAYGGFANVSTAHLSMGDKPSLLVAVKQLRAMGDLRTRLAREILVWGKLQHPNILPLVGYYLSADNDAWLISPYCVNRSVTDYLKAANPSEEDRMELAIDTAKGLQYLHEQVPAVCHGDLKADNVVVNHHKRAMLCDFGLSKVLNDPGGPTGLTTSNHRGTVRYLSPELAYFDAIQGPVPSLQSDIWAWGCLCLQIMTDRMPFAHCKGEGLIYVELYNQKAPDPLTENDLSFKMKRLLRSCWQRNPDDRPTIGQNLKALLDILADPIRAEYPPIRGSDTRRPSLQRSEGETPQKSRFLAFPTPAILRRSGSESRLDAETPAAEGHTSSKPEHKPRFRTLTLSRSKSFGMDKNVISPPENFKHAASVTITDEGDVSSHGLDESFLDATKRVLGVDDILVSGPEDSSKEAQEAENRPRELEVTSDQDFEYIIRLSDPDVGRFIDGWDGPNEEPRLAIAPPIDQPVPFKVGAGVS